MDNDNHNKHIQNTNNELLSLDVRLDVRECATSLDAVKIHYLADSVSRYQTHFLNIVNGHSQHRSENESDVSI